MTFAEEFAFEDIILKILRLLAEKKVFDESDVDAVMNSALEMSAGNSALLFRLDRLHARAVACTRFLERRDCDDAD